MRHIQRAGLHVPGATRFMAVAMFAAFGALLVSARLAAQTAGNGIGGTDVGLDGVPGGRIAPRKTDGGGSVTFIDLAPGRYTVFIADASILRGAVRVSVTDNNVPPRIRLVSEPIQPARAGGAAYALDKSGNRLVFVIDQPPPDRPREPGRQITISVSRFDDTDIVHTRANDPIPGIDVVVKKRPPGALVTTTSDEAGRFSVRVAEPGQYTLSTACKPQNACARFMPSSAEPDAACRDNIRPAGGGCLPYAVELTASGMPLRPSADGTFEFTVDGARGPIVISGRITANRPPVR